MPPHIIQAPDILLVEAPRALPDQPIAGEHLVRADGTISLGLYGAVRVAGLTVDQAREAIEKHLNSFINEPKVHVDVYSYNSRFFYIIADNAGYGQQVYRLNFTGSETVLDAMSQIGGLPAVASKKRIWIARPSCEDEKDSLILPVDWSGIVQCGQTATNYQLFPNDRIFIQSDRLQALDGIVAKVLSPVDRILGTTLLTGLTVYRWQNMGRQGFNTGAATVISP
jgi:protein involved in polysaccharide export with SLBB domain